jgi:hypothetical protein
MLQAEIVSSNDNHLHKSRFGRIIQKSIICKKDGGKSCSSDDVGLYDPDRK